MDQRKTDCPPPYPEQIGSTPHAGPNQYTSAGAYQSPPVGVGSYQPSNNTSETPRGVIYMHEQHIQHVQYTNVQRQQPQATITVVQQAPPPPDYLVPSIMACLCCFWPTALCAIMYSMKSTSLAYADDMDGAWRASSTARSLMISSIVIGVICFAMIGIIIAVGNSNH